MKYRIKQYVVMPFDSIHEDTGFYNIPPMDFWAVQVKSCFFWRVVKYFYTEEEALGLLSFLEKGVFV